MSKETLIAAMNDQLAAEYQASDLGNEEMHFLFIISSFSCFLGRNLLPACRIQGRCDVTDR